MDLPSVPSARLPENYERAKKALQQCARLDECQTWARKAEAMASYAKQASDHSLRKMADRIQARAIRRCGELLKQIEPQSKSNAKKRKDGTVRSFGRTEAARQAGLSERQQKTAMRVANIPEPDFEAAVESDYPPSVTHLAEAGKKPGFAKATKVLGDLRRLARFCESNDAKLVASALMPSEQETARQLVADIDAWLDVFVTNIEE